MFSALEDIHYLNWPPPLAMVSNRIIHIATYVCKCNTFTQAQIKEILCATIVM